MGTQTVDRGDSPPSRASNPGDERGTERPDSPPSGRDAHQPDGERGRPADANGAGGAGDPEATMRPALGRARGRDESDEWRRRLREAGFSEAEAEKLIFERLRPRQEGRTR